MTHVCPNFNDGLVKPQLKSEYGLVFKLLHPTEHSESD